MSYMRIGWPLTYFKSGATGMYVYDDGYSINGGESIYYADKKSVCELITDVVLRQTEDPYFARATLNRLTSEMNIADELKPRVRFSVYFSPQMKEFRRRFPEEIGRYSELSKAIPEWGIALEIIQERLIEQIDKDLFDTDLWDFVWDDEKTYFQCQCCDFIATEDEFERVKCEDPKVGNIFRDNTTLRCKKCGYEAHFM